MLSQLAAIAAYLSLAGPLGMLGVLVALAFLFTGFGGWLWSRPRDRGRSTGRRGLADEVTATLPRIPPLMGPLRLRCIP